MLITHLALTSINVSIMDAKLHHSIQKNKLKRGAFNQVPRFYR